jgi:predicted nucleic acid-binding protein
MKSCFIDATTLVNAKDQVNPSKQKRAIAWIEALAAARAGVVSAQVLREYYWVASRKVARARLDLLRDDIRDMQAWIPAQLELDHFDAGWALQDRFKIGFWDALMLASAHVAGCEIFLSEEFAGRPGFRRRKGRQSICNGARNAARRVAECASGPPPCDTQRQSRSHHFQVDREEHKAHS